QDDRCSPSKGGRHVQRRVLVADRPAWQPFGDRLLLTGGDVGAAMDEAADVRAAGRRLGGHDGRGGFGQVQNTGRMSGCKELGEYPNFTHESLLSSILLDAGVVQW